jgi:hypothetical protein
MEAETQSALQLRNIDPPRPPHTPTSTPPRIRIIRIDGAPASPPSMVHSRLVSRVPGWCGIKRRAGLLGLMNRLGRHA